VLHGAHQRVAVIANSPAAELAADDAHLRVAVAGLRLSRAFARFRRSAMTCHNRNSRARDANWRWPARASMCYRG
jgi:hypothetical protein